jgi:DNA-binding IclR family transcriptional regulator
MKQTASSRNSVEKALSILLAFGPEQPHWGVRELSGRLGISPATVQRMLQTFLRYGFVNQDRETRQYRLGTIYYRFLETLQRTYPVTRAALPLMRRLQARTGETAHLNVRDGVERVCIEHVESSQALKAGMPVGNRSPLYAGASSKCLLAFSPPEFRSGYLKGTKLIALTPNTITGKKILAAELALTRERGYALSLGERSPGLGSLSVPVFDHNGTILSALSLAVPELRYCDQTHRRFCLEELLAAAGQLSRDMGYSGPGPQEIAEEGSVKTGRTSKEFR